MDQTFQSCYWMLTIVMVLARFGTGEFQCKHSCPNNKTCNYQKIQNTCYYVFKDKQRNWFESRQFCADQGLSMVKITQEMIEQNQTYNFSGLFKDIPEKFEYLGEWTDAWLGGRAVDLSDWTFLNNIKANGSEFKQSYDNFNYAKCGLIEMYHNQPRLQMDVGACFIIFPCICRFNKTDIRRSDSMMSWFKARSYCIKLGGDLFYLYQNETLNSFKDDLRLTGINTFHHIGLRHRVWEWIDGSEIILTNWDMDEPNTLNEKCLLLYGHSGKWNDHHCLQDEFTFCQGDDLDFHATSTPPPNNSSNQIDAKMKQYFEYSQLKELVIILGSLLGVFFIITISFIIFNVCTKCSCQSSNEDIEIIENNYYSTSSETENGLVTTKNNRGTSSLDSTVEYSYDASTANETNGGSDFASNKPVIKPKPIIGPKTGDVYSTIDKCLPIKPDDTQLYVNTG